MGATIRPRHAALALAGLAATLGTAGCVEDTACGVCDDDSLVLQILAGPNYANELVQVVSPECIGDRCPAPFDRASYFVESIGPCEETDAALASPRGVSEYCKIAPVVVSSGLQFIFNNLLDPSYIEAIRKRPDNPNLFETYDWKTQVLSIDGPIARYNGDWRDGGASGADRMTRFVSLSCIDMLRADGVHYGAEQYADPATNPCNTLRRLPTADSPLEPYKMQVFTDGKLRKALIAARGKWDDRAIGEAATIDCDTPADGPDTCCSQCDWSLGVAVAKYGTSDPNDPIVCDPLGDRLIDCAAFETKVDRADETACDPSDGDCTAFEIQWADELREIHPDRRPSEAKPLVRDGKKLFERAEQVCRSNSECRDPARLGLAGAECIGKTSQMTACAVDAGDPDCAVGFCRAPWFVECRADPDTTGATGYCVDTRHDPDAAGACFEGTGVVGCTGGDPCRLSTCDVDADGRLTAAECCGDAESCDPFTANVLTPRPRYDRKETLPGLVRALDCDDWFDTPGTVENGLLCNADDEVCSRKQDGTKPPHELSICDRGGSNPRCRICEVRPDGDDNLFSTSCSDCPKGGGSCRDCDDETETLCDAQADLAANCRDDEDVGDWAISFVTRLGGVIYDPALKGVEWRPADLGGTPRAVVEACAEERGLIAARSITDGWRAHDADGIAVEHDAEWDLGMCSGQRYTVTFQLPGKKLPNEYVRDKVGNTLAGKSQYVFETPEFHVVPDSGFPNDALRIGACDSFSLSFSNKFDLSPENLDKIQLLDVTGLPGGVAQGAPRVAGGPGCARDRITHETSGAPPCLTVDVADQHRGVLHARVDPVQFGSVLTPGREYELYAPGFAADPPADAAAVAGYQQAYAEAFWDVCGMPLVLAADSSGTPEYRYLFTVDPERCDEDEDGDEVQLSCDNDPAVYNPEQNDADFDGVGDLADLCPASPDIAAETGDSDRDGIGNGCDSCARSVSRYNEQANALALPFEYYVRNVPSQSDADHDGIGDVCDNCPTVANCESYDEAHPWRLGDPIDVDAGNCQFDGELDMVGDLCAAEQGALAAGPVGLADDDDFDQDGLANRLDKCPRQPELERLACSDDDPCPESRACSMVSEAVGVCNHLDDDGDGVGDACDTCPGTPNAGQLIDGEMQEDDADGDFVGLDCELGDECAMDAGPRPIGFHAVAAAGACCTTLLVADGDDLRERVSGRRLLDAAGNPVRLDCDGDGCSTLPAELADAPGVLAPPAGCVDALAAAGLSIDTNRPVTTLYTQGDLDALWRLQCRLPPLDQDYDGLADGCDLCPFAFDPDNTPYVDATGKLWPNDGAACSGANASGDACEGPVGGDETGDAGSSDGG